MDEIDVFMDHKARKLTLDQLIEHAQRSGYFHRQVILITPQSLNGVNASEFVHITKLNDPKRALAAGLQQQTIDFE